MKKYILTSAALATMLFTACSSEEPVSVGSSDGSGNVCFTAELPGGIMSRAYSDGLTATNLTYALYDEEGTHLPNLDGTATVAGLKASVSLNLVTGKSYTIVFWSEAPGNSHYTFDKDAGTVTVAATGASQDESRDAFFANYSFTVTGAINETIVLKRPFAQINIGTSDLKAFTDAGGSITESGLTVKGYNTLNLLTGKVQGEMVEYTFANAPHATAEKFPASTADKTYDYLVMDYILMGTDKEVVDLTWTSDNAGAPEVSFTGVPVQRNYRTNIYGALLTNPAKFNVEIVPDYGDNDDQNHNVNTVWDGQSVEAPVIDEATKTGVISSAAQLQGLAELTSTVGRAVANDFEGYTFTLTSDIDFGGHAVKPIAGGASRSGGTATGAVFKGVIDGGGHTVKGLSINDASADVYTGFIANLAGESAALKNIVFEDVTLAAPNCEAVAPVALLSEGATIENVTVKSGSVSGKQGVGGLAGRVLKNGHIKGCVNYANIAATTNNAGGIAGTAYYTQTGVAMTIENCTNYGNVHADNVSAGGIAGFCTADVTECTNYGTISANNNSCGGIIGGQNARGVISGCVNEGNIIATATSSGFGGIIGWIRYETNATNYPNQSVIEVTSCRNSGDIKVTSDGKAGIAAGIVGHVYRTAKITGCTNTAKLISATNMVAGIAVYQNLGNACPDAENLLTVTGCTSTTNVDTQMSGALKAEIVYDNTAGANTHIEGNSYQPAQ
ncbi:MAG: hypothetical protein NC187_06205 [Candidatus Amulumruptor caecigallinarius]|nr:hypothetical protein [Candidatus Amulumruptor caecigallinarius]MCM1397063.1 hypothetical protein [Candidatus Amulumruptor caecigallinarius]MCM1454011.1 hypothetical protein [bacterium]